MTYCRLGYLAACCVSISGILCQLPTVNGEVVINCGIKQINLQIQDFTEELERLNAVAFFVGEDNRGYVDPRGVINLSFPFRQFGTMVQLSGNAVVFSNTLYTKTLKGNITKYADFRCQYGNTSTSDTREPATLSLQNFSSTNGFKVNVSICETPYYCPGRNCPPSQTFGDYGIYFTSNSIHMSITTKNANGGDQMTKKYVSAIQQLNIVCEATESRPELKFQSVTNGCAAWGRFHPFSSDINTVWTAVNYNVQTNIICITIDVPPGYDCSAFYITGIVSQCNKSYEESCDNYSGTMCVTPDAATSEFKYGPLYVFPASNPRSLIKYYIDSIPSSPTQTKQSTPSPTNYESFQLPHSEKSFSEARNPANNYSEVSQKFPDEDHGVELDLNEGFKRDRIFGRAFHGRDVTNENAVMESSAETSDRETPSALGNQNIDEIIQPSTGKSPRDREERRFRHFTMSPKGSTRHRANIANTGHQTAVSAASDMRGYHRPSTNRSPEKRPSIFEDEVDGASTNSATLSEQHPSNTGASQSDHSEKETNVDQVDRGKYHVRAPKARNGGSSARKHAAKDRTHHEPGEINHAILKRTTTVTGGIGPPAIQTTVASSTSRKYPKKLNGSTSANGASRLSEFINIVHSWPRLAAEESETSQPSPEDDVHHDIARHKPFLGRFSTSNANRGFVWGAVGALGVFLVCSVGLVVAWTVTRHRNTNTRKERRTA